MLNPEMAAELTRSADIAKSSCETFYAYSSSCDETKANAAGTYSTSSQRRFGVYVHCNEQAATVMEAFNSIIQSFS